MDVFIILTVNGLATGLLLFMMSAGLSVIFGLMGIMNFAHGAFFMLGSYTSTWTYAKTGNFALAMLVGTAVGCFVGFSHRTKHHPSCLRKPIGADLDHPWRLHGAQRAGEDRVGPQCDRKPGSAPLDGDFRVGGVAVSRYRIFIILFGLSTAAAVQYS